MRVSKGSLAIGAVLGLVVGGSGIAVAGAADTGEVITACVSTNGAVRIPPASPSPGETMLAPAPTTTASPGRCLATERQISWNQSGPAGPAGPAGDSGPAGPKGEVGISGLEVVTRDVTFPAGAQRSATITCPEGKVPISGGYAYGRADHWYLEDNMAVGYLGLSKDQDGKLENTWGYRASNHNTWPVTVRTTALCAILP
ncbi:hypothetical protein [Streptosporangium sp. NPDC000509]|uniref:hypothetical protein n=1 Tax=Streptosporangium sp. NPDC000509 TaxID=3366186 RepID=UPI0036CFFD84